MFFLFLYFTEHGMNFRKCGKKIFIFLPAILKFATIQSKPKRAETK